MKYFRLHSVGIDSSQYRHFRDAVKAIDRMWNPSENRRMNLSTLEGRDAARALFIQAAVTANAYYLKHAGREVKSSYGNIRKNAALTAIDALCPDMVKEYVARNMETGMRMVKGDTIIRERIGIEDLIVNERAYSTLQYGNRNSKAYKREERKVQRTYQKDENQAARNENREAQQINKEDAVNRYLGRRGRH